MSLNDDWTNKINRAGKSANTSLITNHITNHQLFFTPTKYPDSGGVYFISYAASRICLGHDAYNLHRYRSVWMNSLGGLGLIVGDFSFVDISGGGGGSGVYKFIEPCEKIWTKPGALKLDTRYKINVEVMVDGDFAGSTRVCLDDEPCLTYSCSLTGGLR